MLSRHRRNIIFFILVALLVTGFGGVNSHANQKNQMTGFVYFYSSTCFSCQEVMEVLESYFEKDHAIKYNISVDRNLELLKQYCDEYGVHEDKRGTVPIVFIGDTYLYGKAQILERVKDQIEYFGVNGTKVLGFSYAEDARNEKKNVNIGSIILAGLINGINPCSLAMFLFFLSLVLATDKSMINCAYAFLIGKFTSFFLLGSIFFNVLYVINIRFFESVIKVLVVGVSLLMIILNLHDFIVSLRHRPDKNILKLPKKMIKANHTVMKKITSRDKRSILFVLCFAIGFVIAFGEFLCTGQVYLATIVSMIHLGEGYSLHTVSYLLLYSTAFVFPMFICVLVVKRCRSTRAASGFLVRHMSIIKLINALAFTAFILFYLFFA